jgi:hypothetical protein
MVISFLAVCTRSLHGEPSFTLNARFQESQQPSSQDPPKPAIEAGSANTPPLSVVLREQLDHLIDRYCTEARSAHTFSTLPLSELAELRERILLDPRPDLLVMAVSTLESCRPMAADSVEAKYYISRLLVDTVSVAERRAAELATESGGRRVPMATPVPGNGLYMPGCDPADVEEPVQRAAYILRMEENGHIARLAARALSVPHALRLKRLEIRRIIRAHLSAASEGDRAFLIDLLDASEIMSKTDREDFDEGRNRGDPEQP